MNAQEFRNLDVWGIYRDPEHVLDALKIIAEHKAEITEENPLILFTNCSSKFTINGKEIGRYMDTLICSRPSDIAMCLSSARYTDEDLGSVSATPEDIAKYLDKQSIPYKIVGSKFAKKQNEDKDNPNIKEIWMARELDVLKLSLEESRSKGNNKVIIYPDVNAGLSMGYYDENDEYIEIWGINFKGLLETDNSWTCLIDEEDRRNLKISKYLINLIKAEGFETEIKENEEPLIINSDENQQENEI